MILLLTSVVSGYQDSKYGVYYNTEEGITAIPDDIPDRSEQINIYSNAIGDVPPGKFVKLSSADLLDLSNNLLRNLTRFMFMGLVSLKHLNLGRNKIISIDDYALCQVPELRRLDLPNNLIAHLSTIVFSCLKHLNYLDLDGNPLTMLEPIDYGIALTLALRIPVFQSDSRMCWLWEEVRKSRIRFLTDKNGPHTPHYWDVMESICLVQGN